MATLYVDSADGNDATPPSVTWWNGSQATYQSIAGALAVAVDGDTIICSHTHNFSPASANIVHNAASGAKIFIESRNRTTGVYAKGAQETPGTNGFSLRVATAGSQTLHYKGVLLVGHNGNSSSNLISICSATSANINQSAIFEDCTVGTQGSGGTLSLFLGPGAASGQAFTFIEFRNTVLRIQNSTASAITYQNTKVRMIGVSFEYAGATKPNNLFSGLASEGDFDVEIIASDLSGYEKSGGAYFNVVNMRGSYIFISGCKRDATPTWITGTWPNDSMEIVWENVDSADTYWMWGKATRAGTAMASSSVYNSTSATKFGNSSGQNISIEVVASSDCNKFNPFNLEWGSNGYDTRTSASTGVVKIAQASGASNLTDTEAELEVVYRSDASTPKATLITSRNSDPYGAGSALASDTDTWTGLTTPVKQKLQVGPFTPAEASEIKWRAIFRKAGTYYLDPVMTY